MAKKVSVSLLFSFLISFIMVGGFFHANLLANDVSSMEREILKKHLLATEGLKEATVAFSNARLGNIEKIENFLDEEYIEKQLSKWGFNANQIKTAVRTLTNSELEYLARQSENVSKNFFGGADTGRTIGLVTLGALAVVLIMYEFDILGFASRLMKGF